MSARKHRKATPAREAVILTIEEWHEMRHRGEAPRHMLPRKRPARFWANLPPNVVRLVPRPRPMLSQSWVLTMGDEAG